MTHGGSRRRRRKRREMGLQTAGLLDDIGGAVSGGYDAIAGAGDFLAGSTDEAIGRQFDDDPGGGILDGFQSAIPGLSQSQETTERQAEEGILPDDAAQPSDVAASDASIQRTQSSAPPGGTAVQVIRIRNGLAFVSDDNVNRRATDKQDVVSPEGAVLGIGAAAAGAAAAGASVGAVAGPPGVAIGAASGIAGSLLAATVEEQVGALGYTATAFIEGEDVGQTIASVGVPAGGVGMNGKNVQLEHTVPQEPGEYTVNIVVSLWQTGDVVAELSTDITVEEGATSNTTSDQDDDDESTGPGGIIGFATENPGLAVVAAGGGLVALNSLAGGLGEGLADQV